MTEPNPPQSDDGHTQTVIGRPGATCRQHRTQRSQCGPVGRVGQKGPSGESIQECFSLENNDLPVITASAHISDSTFYCRAIHL